VKVRLLSLPYDILLKSERHIDSVLAQCAETNDVPAEICAVLNRIVRQFGDLRQANISTAEAAIADSVYRDDVVIDLPRDAADAVMEYLEAVEELNRISVAVGRPDLKSPEDAMTFRRWACEEVVGQLRRRKPPKPAPI
jgi:hypothetical protein